MISGLLRFILGGDRFSQTMGSALRASHFLLLRQKKVSKEKATPGSAPLRVSLRYSAARAACQNSPAAQTRQADFPRPACVAQRLSRGPKKRLGSCNSRKNDWLRSTAKKGQKSKSPRHPLSTDGFPGPLRGAEQRRNAGGSRRALSEGRSPELRSRPAFRVAQGIRRSRTPTQGWPFLWLLSFGHTKESTPASKAEPHANRTRKPEQHKEPSKC